jgi:hypothetical protein
MMRNVNNNFTDLEKVEGGAEFPKDLMTKS